MLSSCCRFVIAVKFFYLYIEQLPEIYTTKVTSLCPLVSLFLLISFIYLLESSCSILCFFGIRWSFVASEQLSRGVSWQAVGQGITSCAIDVVAWNLQVKARSLSLLWFFI